MASVHHTDTTGADSGLAGPHPPDTPRVEAVPAFVHPTILFLNVLLIATCGLIYELLAGTLASYVLGDSVTQFSLIIGIFDLLGIVQASLRDPQWASPVAAPTGYLTVGLMFWVFCFAMSRYSMYTERRLNTGHKR